MYYHRLLPTCKVPVCPSFATWHLFDWLSLPSFSRLDFWPKLLYSLTNKNNTYTEGLSTTVRIAVSLHDHGNTYKGKHWIGAGLQFQRISPLAWWRMVAHRQTCCWSRKSKYFSSQNSRNILKVGNNTFVPSALTTKSSKAVSLCFFLHDHSFWNIQCH